jgi:hypothetical protein
MYHFLNWTLADLIWKMFFFVSIKLAEFNFRAYYAFRTQAGGGGDVLTEEDEDKFTRTGKWN